MSKKLDKLNEVNSRLDAILKKIETRIFLENIVFDHENQVGVKQPEISI